MSFLLEIRFPKVVVICNYLQLYVFLKNLSAIIRVPEKPKITNQNANKLKKITKMFRNLQGDIKKSMKIFSTAAVVNRFYVLSTSNQKIFQFKWRIQTKRK